MKKLAENRLLPGKFYYFSIGLIMVMAVLLYFSRGWEGLIVVPYAAVIYSIGRAKQRERNPKRVD